MASAARSSDTPPVRPSVRSWLLLSSLLIALGVCAQVGSPTEVFGFGSSNVKRYTGRLADDPNSTVAIKVGQIVQIDVRGIEGHPRPVLQVVGHDSSGSEGSLVPVRRGYDNNRYRAVAVGRTDIGGVSRPVWDECTPETCIDLIGERQFVVSVVVTE
jgi:hypothetical protein